MTLLIAGLLLFTGTHLFLSLANTQVDAARQKLGDAAVKGIVAILSIGGIALIVFGWRATETTWLYTAPSSLRGASLALITIALYLFVVANRPSVIKRIIRHPQLIGLVLWSSGHLLLNGDSRSLLLFGGLGVWAILEIPLINRRDGSWVKPPAPGIATEFGTVLATVAFIAFLIYVHPWLAGVPAITGL